MDRGFWFVSFWFLVVLQGLKTRNQKPQTRNCECLRMAAVLY